MSLLLNVLTTQYRYSPPAPPVLTVNFAEGSVLNTETSGSSLEACPEMV